MNSLLTRTHRTPTSACTVRLFVLLGALLAPGCKLDSLLFDAPAMYDPVQDDLERLGRTSSVSIDTAISIVEETVSEETPIKAAKERFTAALPALPSELTSEYWTRALDRSGLSENTKPDATKEAAFSRALRAELYGLRHECVLFETAVGGDGDSAKAARDELLARYIVRIQEYHDANLDDVFEGSASFGLFLDFGALVASTLATAFNPVTTKTALAAAAAVFSGTRLAASKNLLNERTATGVMNAMIAARVQALQDIRAGMKQPAADYTIHMGIVDLSIYLNEGGLHRALAALDAKAGQDRKDAEQDLRDTTSGKDGENSDANPVPDENRTQGDTSTSNRTGTSNPSGTPNQKRNSPSLDPRPVVPDISPK